MSTNDTISSLGTTANTLLQQYNSKSINLQQFKDSITSQIVPTWNTLQDTIRTDASVHETNDTDIHKINYVIRFLRAVE